LFLRGLEYVQQRSAFLRRVAGEAGRPWNDSPFEA